MSKQSDERKAMILEEMARYVQDGIFMVNVFRREHGNIYSRLNYNFGSVQGAVDALGEHLQQPVLISTMTSRAVGFSDYSLRNRLAYDQLQQLINEKHSYQDIAEAYGTTRQLVFQLHRKLSLTMQQGEELLQQEHDDLVLADDEGSE